MANERKIMVVDDEAPIRETLSTALGRAGFEVIQAASAEEAIAKAGKGEINVYFIDLLLPEMNGVELCRQLRHERPAAFMFAMTGYASVFDLEQCREAGFDDYFPKPFRLQGLLAAARDAFDKLERWGKN